MVATQQSPASRGPRPTDAARDGGEGASSGHDRGAFQLQSSEYNAKIVFECRPQIAVSARPRRGRNQARFAVLGWLAPGALSLVFKIVARS